MSIIKREGLPHFVVKKNLQKSGTRGIYFSDVVTEEVLRDVCLKITGQMEFTCEYVDNSLSLIHISLLYGRNGSGKSTIARGFRQIAGEVLPTISRTTVFDKDHNPINLSLIHILEVLLCLDM